MVNGVPSAAYSTTSLSLVPAGVKAGSLEVAPHPVKALIVCWLMVNGHRAHACVGRQYVGRKAVGGQDEVVALRHST